MTRPRTHRLASETSEALKYPTPIFVRGTYGRRLPSDLPKDSIPYAGVDRRLPPVGLSLVDLPEAEIIARAARHDAAASAELQWRSYTRVLMLLSARLGSRSTAHELVPRVMDAMQLAVPDIPPHTDFSRWLAGFVAGTSLEL